MAAAGLRAALPEASRPPRSPQLQYPGSTAVKRDACLRQQRQGLAQRRADLKRPAGSARVRAPK